MTDEELINYFYTHSRTERALFAKEHVVRMLELAGEKPENVAIWPSFVTVREAAADYWIALAKKRMAFRAQFRVIEGEKK